jgi:hypothetical protein
MTTVGKSTKLYTSFDPRSLGNCALWLDAADTNTLTLSGSNVTSWRDKSGSGNNATGGVSPTYSSGGIAFNGSSQYLTTPITSFPTTETWFVVFQFSGSGTNKGWNILGSSATTGGRGMQVYRVTTDYNYGGDKWGTGTIAFTPILQNARYIGEMTYSNPSFNVYTNGTITSSSPQSVTFSGTGTTNIGVGSNGTFFWQGTLFEIIYYDYVLTTTQRQQVEGYLSWKWSTSITSPSSISGLVLWLDATDSGTMFTDTSATTIAAQGQLVARWNDKSSSGNYAVQATSGNRPTLSTYTTNRPALYFASNGLSLVTVNNSATTGNSSRTTFVFQVAPGTSTVRIGTGTHAVNTPPTAYGYDNNPRLNYIQTPYVYGTGVGGTLTLQTPSVLYAYYDSSTSTVGGGYNFTLPFANLSTTLNTTSTPWYFGLRPDGDGCLNSYIVEFLQYNRMLSTSEVQQIYGYFATKYNLVYPVLPSTQPYKSLPPFQRPFTPLDISGCSLWLDAADRNTVSLSGSNVTAWSDKSGNGLTITPVPGQSLPVYEQTFNGSYRTVTATNTTSIMWYSTQLPASTFVSSSGITYFLVARITDGYLLTKFFAGGRIIAVELGATGLRSDFNTTIVNTTASTSVPFVASIQYDGATSGFTIYYNGSVVGSATVTAPSYAFSAYLTLFGQYTNIPQFGGIGSISEYVIYNASLTSSQRQLVEAYLANKWGLRSSFPLYPIAPVFAPTQISNCALWLDAADTSTLTLSGSNVTNWTDKSGLFNNAVLGTFGTGPTVTSSKTLLFTRTPSSAQYLRTQTGKQTSRAVTFVFVARTLNDVSGGTFFDARKTAPPQIPFHAVLTDRVFARDNSNSLQQIAYSFPTTLSIFVLQTDLNIVQIFTNGTQVSSNSVTLNMPSSDAWYAYIGATTDASGYANLIEFTSSSEYAEILMYNSFLTTAQRQQVELYLSKKWNISVASSTQPTTALARISPGLSPQFTPLLVSGLSLWLDAADLSKVTLSGASVTAVLDKSPSNNTLTGATGFNYVSNFLGRYPAFYTPTKGSSATLGYTSQISLSTPFAIFIVMKEDTWAPNDIGYLLDSSPSGSGIGRPYIIGGLLTQGVGGSGVYDTSVASVLFIQWGTSLVTYANGMLQSTGNVTFTTGGITVGNRFSLNSSWGGFICEILLYSGTISTYQRQQVEGYLAWKWGLQASLPSTHPYRMTKLY